MSIVACPSCNARYTVKSPVSGKWVRCKCGVRFDSVTGRLEHVAPSRSPANPDKQTKNGSTSQVPLAQLAAVLPPDPREQVTVGKVKSLEWNKPNDPLFKRRRKKEARRAFGEFAFGVFIVVVAIIAFAKWHGKQPFVEGGKVHYYCPVCNTRHGDQISDIGQSARCSKCGAPMVIPYP